MFFWALSLNDLRFSYVCNPCLRYNFYHQGRPSLSQSRGDTLYHYDPLNQLKKVEYPGYTEELFYDKAGNRTRRMAQGVEELYQYDPATD